MADKSTDLEHSHEPEDVRDRLEGEHEHSYLGDAVLGAIDGAVTTFAVVSGVAGGGLAGGVAVLLGFANLLADGFSMAVSNYESTASTQQMVERRRRQEQRHIEHAPEGEREEIRQIFKRKGFEGDLLERIVDTITDDRELWINTMLSEEYGLQLEGPSPWKAAATTFVAFLVIGFLPLLPFLLTGLSPEQTFIGSAAVTGVTFLGIGLLKGYVTEEPLWRSGLTTLLAGGGAATLAYLTGSWLRQFVETI
ncbi:hypothetical protein FIV42_01990 [Persicimonas caeni]|uniref:VIT family protein n=1 Tax=Persicimonas caeni TaxID=2292766 RepID=A0A4Y6PMS4_PERCE|nr:VIT1/CCC1 transporter family protein [Persicimonas caeni]QDG49550.1 hypothetical protein FIV42_01990 [Persicimonas caeni]QED30771.1 hypothetical protein FRD00_01985 [Persicimonas caeni]